LAFQPETQARHADAAHAFVRAIYDQVIGMMEPRSRTCRDEKTGDAAKRPTGGVFLRSETVKLCNDEG
jgi:hypothetical protein